MVQASFDGEQLATDPVEHREQPQFSTELAWELDRRTLHQHRLQRTPIKLQCFAVDSVSKKRESVGYIVLDLRSVQEVKQEPRWYPLLSSKYTKQRPALLLSMVLENDTKSSEPSPDRFKAKKAPPRQGSPVTELLPDKLEAMLIPDQGYHQVGPADHCTDMFVLSVTVAFATKLEQLISSTMKLSAEGSEFFFYYTLLGNDITSEPFHNLLSPDFEPERASVRIRSSKQIFLTFLSQQPSLQIHLCCGNHSLGSTDVSLSALSAVSVDLENKPATVEGVFVLQPPKRTKQMLPALPADLQPTIGVAVTLRREEVSPQVHILCTLDCGSGAQTQSIRASVPAASVPLSAPQRSSPVPKPPESSSPPGPPPPPSSHTESEAESLLEELQHGKEKIHSHAEAELEGGTSSISVSAPKVSIPSSAHHYRFSLDLRSLGKLSLTQPIMMCVLCFRYSYRFFGSAAPIMTNPPVELQRNMEVSLPQSYCAFDFAALPQQLQDTFLRVPLAVEVWHRDSTSRDQLIGRASIQLSHLLSSERSRILSSTGEQTWRQTHQDQIPVNEPVEPMQPSSQPADPRPAAPSVPPASLGPTAPRDTLEYRTALELELWKEEQEDLFDDQLRKKELSHMQALAEEWRRRDREREALVKKKVEFNLLEEQLQKTLSDLERREKQLAEAELETQRLQKELRAEHDHVQRELQDSSRRLQQDCDHRVALERDKVRLMEEERARLLQQIADGESRYKQLEKEFQLYREQQNVRPEFRLQSEINLLTLEKVELERKLESTTKSKLHYKQQWGRALKELARFKQREQENAMTRLKKQQAELEAMRLRYLATEEKEVVRQNRQELDNIRNELNRLKLQEERVGPGPSPGPAVNETADDHLSRLLEERDTLLRTGVYTHEDRIIAELNRQIQDAMRDRGNM
uniref:Centrosomal protein 120 n=1 Tax=Mastacembelus armatus TaxID=205130 RepID=A0A7N8Y2D7_9TELE